MGCIILIDDRLTDDLVTEAEQLETRLTSICTALKKLYAAADGEDVVWDEGTLPVCDAIDDLRKLGGE